MNRGQLSDLFTGVAAKRLSAVETRPEVSNQHEFNGSATLRQIFGDDDRKQTPARYIWLGGEEDAISVDDRISWYDSRRAHATRTEYRLYYFDNAVTGLMKEGDTLFVVLPRDGTPLIVVVPEGSTLEGQLLWLFGLGKDPGFAFVVQRVDPAIAIELNFAARYILSLLNIDPAEPEAALLDRLIGPFGHKFPATAVFSAAARKSCIDLSAPDDPDAALHGWFDREQAMFKRLERRIVAERIESGFHGTDGSDVDGFLSFSLSVQNRRKSRAGFALENHIEAVLRANGIAHSRGALTENGNRPDFLFPGAREYHDPAFPDARLTMLGAKSTLKERWRQVLSEAGRIGEKHLLTLATDITVGQTDEMAAKHLRLVVPRPLQTAYRPEQQAWMMDVGAFIALARERQGAR